MREPCWEELSAEAGRSGIDSAINLNDRSLFAPEKMTEAIDKLCSAGGQRVPVSAPEYAMVVYRSLGRLISGNVKRLSVITGQKFRKLFIMGGGSRSATLCDIIGAETGLGIIRGPAEASASGNILLQAAAAGELDSPAKIERAARSLFSQDRGRNNV